jgi:hypothetical protein
MRIRLAAVATAAVVTGLALPGSAAPAPKPQITDPAGDAFIPEGSIDILSALFTTDKPRKKPSKLVVTVTYGAPPDSYDPASDAVVFTVPGCGEVLLNRSGAATDGFADCVEGIFPVSAQVKGNTVTFTLPFKAIKGLKAGAVLTGLRTWTSGADPVLGYSPAMDEEQLTADTASTTATYKVA